MKKAFFFICLSFITAVHAKTIDVTAVGNGETYDWAVLNAVENAVRQTSDITIKSTGLQKIDASVTASGKWDDKDGNFTVSVQDNSQFIPAEYKGVVSSFDVVEHTEKDSTHTVKIKATVVREDVYDSRNYTSKRPGKKADYSLAVMPFQTGRTVHCLGRQVSANALNRLINRLFVERLLASRKLTLVDRSHFDAYEDELNLITGEMTLPENKVRLKNIVPADYILVGAVDTLTVTSKKSVIELTGETIYENSAEIKLSYRVLESSTMEIISAGSATKTITQNEDFSSCFDVEENLLSLAIDEAGQKILNDIFPND